MAGLIEGLPLISIVTPSYNQGEFLEECIDSILSQNYPNLEYVIMDGGSSDNSVEIIRKYQKYLTYWQSQPDGGQYNAISEGFKKTSGEIMTWLNSDDKYHENAFFKVAYILLCNPQINWLTARHAFWDGEGKTKYIETDWLPVHYRGQYLRKEYDKPFIQQESTFWRRSLWEKAGRYLRSDLGFAGDLELWTRFFRHAQLHTVDTLLGGYRIHGNQKVALHLELYHEESEKILSEEQSLFVADDAYNPPAPDLIEFDVKRFTEFMKSFNGETSAVYRSFTSEHLISYLVHRLTEHGSERDCQVREIRNSLSWRITKPLRWLGDKVRGIASLNRKK